MTERESCQDLLMILIIIWSCHQSCVSCACTPQIDVTLYRCTHSQLTEVPQIVHPGTTELDLSHNLIEILHEDSFIRFSNIKKLILRHNRIHKITERAFIHLGASLEVLDLSGNQLTSNRLVPFPVNAFQSLNRLVDLNLSQNPIGLLPSGFLQFSASSITHFRLSASTVEVHIEAGAFRRMHQLHHLDLAKNTLIDFHENSFDGLKPEGFSRLRLSDVRWKCDCEILWFRRWLDRIPRKAFLGDSQPGGECESPSSWKGHSLLLLTLEDLNCSPRLVATIPPSGDLHSDSPIQVIGFHGFNVTLSCTFIGEPIVQTEWYQNDIPIEPHWKRMEHLNRSDITYTTTLQLRQLEYATDSGLYKCQAVNQKGKSVKYFQIDVQGSFQGDPKQVKNPLLKHLNVGWLESRGMGKYMYLIAITAAVNIVIIVTLGALTYYCMITRRCKNCRGGFLEKYDATHDPRPCTNSYEESGNLSQDPLNGVSDRTISHDQQLWIQDYVADSNLKVTSSKMLYPVEKSAAPYDSQQNSGNFFNNGKGTSSLTLDRAREPSTSPGHCTTYYTLVVKRNSHSPSELVYLPKIDTNSVCSRPKCNAPSVVTNSHIHSDQFLADCSSSPHCSVAINSTERTSGERLSCVNHGFIQNNSVVTFVSSSANSPVKNHSLLSRKKELISDFNFY